MTIAEQMKTALANADPVWRDVSADLARAVIERATGLGPAELRAFVANTATGARFDALSDKELAATAALVANALL